MFCNSVFYWWLILVVESQVCIGCAIVNCQISIGYREFVGELVHHFSSYPHQTSLDYPSINLNCWGLPPLPPHFWPLRSRDKYPWVTSTPHGLVVGTSALCLPGGDLVVRHGSFHIHASIHCHEASQISRMVRCDDEQGAPTLSEVCCIRGGLQYWGSESWQDTRSILG